MVLTLLLTVTVMTSSLWVSVVQGCWLQGCVDLGQHQGPHTTTVAAARGATEA
jgi:hypothetical protein